MKEISLLVENITPLFVAGADMRNIKNDGLRSPSLRGLMRWWFRAIMGGMVSSIENLRIIENKVFGGGENGHKSPVIIISETISDERKKSYELAIELGKKLPRYFWFSMTMGENKNREVLKKGKFRIKLKGRGNEFNVAVASLWALLYLGGVGSRSRRAAGSLNVVNVERNDGNIEFLLDRNDLEGIVKFYEEGLKKIFSIYSNFSKSMGMYGNGRGNYCILKHENADVAIITNDGEFFDEWSKALLKMEEVYSQYRKRLNYSQKKLLGLPIKIKEERFASPCIFGILHTENGYVGRIVKFYSAKSKENIEELKNVLKKLDEKYTEKKINLPEVKQ